ncbi:MAG: helix-turn-helix domain-containing protein [Lautropia sp.]|nr:helix-turn-helix domain-containing protein [Lautropia sp.]MCL4701982.1 helix-turn-helix domain-containing protein [Burkholderiaceae bacterium]MCZ2414761.1 helix-turn-helix domain-containing protein [Burkholderiales bacterium]MDL1906080.1 helix-turn-helix domain-containing protein [Betaproteobacteria bacterium PRO1]RIK91411.1 MAG: DNA-binding protein [Burkholderiales bacterium]
MPSFTPTMSTDLVAPRERVRYWSDWIDRVFCGLQSDVYGETDFDGHMATEQAGDVVLTRLEADRHRVLKNDRQVRGSDVGYLKIVAPYRGTAGVEQWGRQAWVTPGEWCIYDTTDSYRVANPVRVEHLIVMVPKAPLVERGLPLEKLMAQRLGSQGGISRLALQAMRGAWQELPSIAPSAARGVGETIMHLVQLSLLELAGRDSAPTQREALRESIKQLVARRLGDARLSVDAIAVELNCSRRQLYNAFGDEPDGVAGFVLAQRLEACRRDFEDRHQDAISITEIALRRGFNHPAHFSRAFKARFGVTPSEWRQRAVLGARA